MKGHVRGYILQQNDNLFTQQPIFIKHASQLNVRTEGKTSTVLVQYNHAVHEVMTDYGHTLNREKDAKHATHYILTDSSRKGFLKLIFAHPIGALLYPVKAAAEAKAA